MADDFLGVAPFRAALDRYRLLADGSDPAVVVFPNEAASELVRTIGQSTAQSLVQVLRLDPQRWDPESFANRVLRNLARQGRSVERVLLLPHRGIGMERLEQQITMDEAAGIRVLSLTISQLGVTQSANSHTFFIVDDSIVVSESFSNSQDGGYFQWTVSTRTEDADRARSNWSEIVETALKPSNDFVPDLEEPLALSADLINGVAPVLCTSDHVDPEGCSWYHGTWQYLRLLNLVSTPTWHSEFYLEALRSAFDRGLRKVLISGTADYSVLSYVLRAGSEISGLDVTVLDMCPTPLFACRWYAHQVQRSLRTVCADVLAFDETGYDLIVSDAFLTRFKAEESAKVLRKWVSYLRTGGEVVTTVRVHDEGSSVRDEDKAAKDFSERARMGAERWRSLLRRSPEEVSRLALDYAQRMRSERLGTQADVLKLFQAAELEAVSAELADVPGELWPSAYLRIHARTL